MNSNLMFQFKIRIFSKGSLPYLYIYLIHQQACELPEGRSCFIRLGILNTSFKVVKKCLLKVLEQWMISESAVLIY